MPAEDQTKFQNLVKQLDELELGKLTLDDVRSVRNPVLSKAIRDFIVGRQPDMATGHNSHFVHISHYSTMSAPQDPLRG
jgi:hypothetical protein